MSTKKEFKLAYELLPLSKLKENPKNPNVMSEKMFKLLVDNIEREGFKDPIIVRPKDEDGFYLIEDGHHRKMALVELGFEVGPCVIADFKGDLDLSSLMLNKIKGHLAPDKVGAILMGLREEYSSQDLANLTGYSSQDLENYASVLSVPELPDLGHYGSLSSFPYAGGKYHIRHRIISALPEHKCFVEVFGGAGHVILNKPASLNDVYNDLDGRLVNCFEVIRNRLDEFTKKAEFILYSRELHDKFQNDPIPEDEVEAAVQFFYIMRTSFAGMQDGTFAYGRGTKHGTSRLWYGFDQLKLIHDRLKEIVIEKLDFRKVIVKYDSPDTVFFLDPPYYGIDYYAENFEENDHEDLYKLLMKACLGKWIMTYNNVPWVRDKYKAAEFRLASSPLSMPLTMGGAGSRLPYHNLVIMNYNPAEITKMKGLTKKED